jgi:hypothetical protein
MYLDSTESAAPQSNERSRCYIWPQEWQPGRSEKPGGSGLVLIKATGIRSRPKATVRFHRHQCRPVPHSRPCQREEATARAAFPICSALR